MVVGSFHGSNENTRYVYFAEISLQDFNMLPCPTVIQCSDSHLRVEFLDLAIHVL